MQFVTFLTNISSNSDAQSMAIFLDLHAECLHLWQLGLGRYHVHCEQREGGGGREDGDRCSGKRRSHHLHHQRICALKIKNFINVFYFEDFFISCSIGHKMFAENIKVYNKQYQIKHAATDAESPILMLGHFFLSKTYELNNQIIAPDLIPKEQVSKKLSFLVQFLRWWQL